MSATSPTITPRRWPFQHGRPAPTVRSIAAPATSEILAYRRLDERDQRLPVRFERLGHGHEILDHEERLDALDLHQRLGQPVATRLLHGVERARRLALDDRPIGDEL